MLQRVLYITRCKEHACRIQMRRDRIGQISFENKQFRDCQVAFLTIEQQANQFDPQLSPAVIHLGATPSAIERVLIVVHGLRDIAVL